MKPTAAVVVAGAVMAVAVMVGCSNGARYERGQVGTAEGWRVVDTAGDGSAFPTGVATSAADLDELWRSASAQGAPPKADFEREIVVMFRAVDGTGDWRCGASRFGGLNVNGQTRRVIPLIARPAGDYVCADETRPGRAYAVAIERAILPTGPTTFDVLWPLGDHEVTVALG